MIREAASLINRLPTYASVFSNANVEFESVNGEFALPSVPTPTTVNVPPETVVGPAYVLSPDNFTIPDCPSLFTANSGLEAPEITPAMVNVLPLAAATPPPEDPTTMPRLTLRDTVLLDPSSNKVPPFNAKALFVTALGTTPRLFSDVITSVPPLICVLPEYVLTPASFCRPPPSTTPPEAPPLIPPSAMTP